MVTNLSSAFSTSTQRAQQRNEKSQLAKYENVQRCSGSEFMNHDYCEINNCGFMISHDCLINKLREILRVSQRLLSKCSQEIMF